MSNDSFLPDKHPHGDGPGAVTRSRRFSVSGTSTRSGCQARHDPVDPQDPEGPRKSPWSRYGYDASSGQEPLTGKAESAASSLLSKRASSLKACDVLLVLDAGGMTVDTAVYEVIRTNPPLTRAITCRNGLACGSTFTNEHFRKWLTTLPHLRIFDHEVRAEWIDSQVVEFEKYKRSYDGNLSEPILLSLYEKIVPGWVAVSENSIEVTNKRMKGFFDHEIDQIIGLASTEIEKCRVLGFTVNRMLLSGGFSLNPYYWSRIQSAFSKNGIAVQKPNTKNISLSKGVVASALNQSTITECQSRFSIGVDQKRDYDEDIHGKRKHLNIYRDCHEGHEIAKSIQWLLGKVSQGFLSLFHDIVLFFDKGNWTYQFIPTEDRSIIREHRYRGDDFYAMQTEIGTLIPHVAESTTQDADADADEDGDDGLGAGQDSNPEEEDYSDDPTLSAVQRGKRRARSTRLRQSAAEPEEQTTPPPPARGSARKRRRAEDDTAGDVNGGSMGLKRRRKTSRRLT